MALKKKTEDVLAIALSSRALMREMATRVVTAGAISYRLELAVKNMVADKKSSDEVLSILRTGPALLSKRAKDNVRIGMDYDPAWTDLVHQLEI